MIRKTKYPLLRNLVIFQCASIIVGSLGFLIAYRWIVKADFQAAASSSWRQLEAVLKSRQEQWRAWKLLGQEDVLMEDINAISMRFPFWNIQVISDVHPVPKPNETELIIPPSRILPGVSNAYVVYAKLDQAMLAKKMKTPGSILYSLLILCALFLSVSLVSAQFIYGQIYRPLRKFAELFTHLPEGGRINAQGIRASGEILQFMDEVTRLHEHAKALEKEAAVATIAKQVAHDIRSPLAALDVVVKDAAQLPEEKRLIIRRAVSRIHDIANDLTKKNHETVHTPEPDAAERPSRELISSHLAPLVTEKRLQFRSKIRVEIEMRLDASSYGLFAMIQPNEFKRAVSNLINNAVEAFGEQGSVIVHLACKDGAVVLRILDNGKGMPPELLAKLGRRGETHGKDGGSGLGLYHAKTSIEAWGGSLELQSEVGKGTTVVIKLPQAEPPAWFVSQLKLEPGGTVVVLDDDTTIHQVWQGRFDSARTKEHAVEVLHFSTPQEIRAWTAGNPAKAASALYLTDFELIGHKETGLSLVEELKIGERAILVTSRFEEKGVLDECLRLKVRMIPKGLAGFVPISFQSSLDRPDAVLIDDDELVHMTWELAAQASGKRLRVFSKPGDFLPLVASMDQNTPIYVDSKLGGNVRGEEFAKELHAKGFRNLYLATGRQKESLPDMPWIKEVVGKKAPWT